MTSSLLTLLGWSVVLLLVHVIAQAGAATMEVGLKVNLGARDDAPAPSGVLAGRLKRALANFLETYPAFVALALALAVANRESDLAVIGAQLWFWGRVAFLPAYALGIPVLRTLLWGVSVGGLVAMLIALLG